MKKAFVLGAVAAVGMAAVPAQLNSHHAVAAQFDISKNIDMTGKLVRVDWINPHAWFHFETVNPTTGEPEIWSLETTGPNGLRRLGLSDRRLFTVGDEYRFTGYPDWTGDTKAFATAFTFPDGRTVVIGFVDEQGQGAVPPTP